MGVIADALFTERIIQALDSSFLLGAAWDAMTEPERNAFRAQLDLIINQTKVIDESEDRISRSTAARA